MLNEREINSRDSEPGTLFRATTLASTLMEQYMRSTCPSFVSLALKDVVKQIIESKESCEVKKILDSLTHISRNRPKRLKEQHSYDFTVFLTSLDRL